MAVALDSGNIEIQEEDDDEEEDDSAYVNVDTPAQQKHPQRMVQSGRRWYRMLGMGFGLLCGVQALLNIGLRLSLYSELNAEKNNLVKDLDQILSRYNNVTKERDDLKKILCESGGFTFDGGVCYNVSTEWKTWNASRQYCRDRQSDLMVINSKEKQDLVVRVAGRQQNMWLGLSDRQTEGVWMWVDGTPLTTRYWSPGQPDDRFFKVEDCDCVVYYRHDNDGEWFDNPCSQRNRGICERVLC